MNKHGMVGEVLPWVVRILIATGLMILLLMQIWMVTETKVTARDMELDLYTYRLLAGPHGILYRDPVDDPKGTHPVPWVVDEQRISTTLLENEDPYTEEDERYAARIRLYNRAQDIGRKPAKEAYHHKAVYDHYASFAQAGLSTPGGAMHAHYLFPVTVRSYTAQPNGPGTYTDTTKWLELDVVRRT